MDKPSLLDRLCTQCAIDIEYTDVWNKRHAVPDATKYRLLAAMQILADPADLARALEEVEARQWRRLLPPIQVLPEGRPTAHAVLTIPPAKTAMIFRWRLTLESGEIIDGHCMPADLAVLEQREFADELYTRYALPLPSALATGYHILEIESPAGKKGEQAEQKSSRIADLPPPMHDSAAMRLIVVPNACYQPAILAESRRVWGPAIQLYALRSQRNWGIGDFTDLKGVVEFAAQAGAGIVGTNPLHTLFPNDPARASPYSPSSRNFLNALYVDLEAIEEFSECEAAVGKMQEPSFHEKLQVLRAGELVNYREVGALKLSALEILFRHFQHSHLALDSQRALAFRQFQAQGGLALRHHALFEALQEHFSRTAPLIQGWPDWPRDYHDPYSAAVAAFAATHEERIDFYAYLQWQAAQQLATVAQCSQECGLGVGLYQDMAIGVAADGAESWAGQALYAQGAHVGAPPDEFNPIGQDWGLPPLIPHCLREAAYMPIIETLRKNMQYAGALRIDHVMGLMRLFWVPAGAVPGDGAYVQYPLNDLIGIVALESHRNRCMVVGEDLGTVPQQVRDALQRAMIFSTRLFYFETMSDGTPKAPADYPENALVAVGTHDLPTLAGFWQAYDLDLRRALGLYPSEQLRNAQMTQRSEQRKQFVLALEQQALLPVGGSSDPAAYRKMSADLAQAIHIYIARTPAKIMAVQMEDVFGQLQQVNLPASGDNYPNWQRKLPYELETWADEPRLQALVHALRHTRSSGIVPAGGADMPSAGTKPHSIPRATYRLQFGQAFTFVDAEQLIPYLNALGISHCYASPFFKARPGSTHGYDIINHAMLNPEIGTGPEFNRYVQALRRHGMGQILDIVPNHMAVMGSDNAWWLDVLENGQSSRYAEFFDIDWQPQNRELHNKVLVPVLSDQYGNVLDKGDIKLVFDRQCGEFSIWYEEHRFPVDPREYPRIINHRWQQLTKELPADHPHFVALQSLVTAFGHLPPKTELAAERRVERDRDKQIHKQHLADLCERCMEIAHFIQDNVNAFNGDPADPKSVDLLHRLIKEQAYRLGFWRVASDEINYRHFADVATLAGLCTERDEVFDATHRMIMELLADAKIDGLRIDHTDGLYNPLQYFRSLRQAYRPIAIESGRNPGDYSNDGNPLYIVIEKILAEHERLPSHWPVQGTSGYDFANLVNGLFIDAGNESRMDRTYAAFIGMHADFSEIVTNCKKSIMQVALASALNALANQLSHIAQMDRHTCDFTTNSLRDALIEVAACFPTYRTYVTDDVVSRDDRRAIEWAVSAAKKRSRVADTSIFDFTQEALLTRLIDGKGPAYRNAVIKFAMKFQQFSSPVMAKGMEDTSFYIYHRLVSLNEVGGDPRTFGISLHAFHAASRDRAKNWPHTMLATSTHDSKRSEDVRARINALSELPALWRFRLRRWSRINRSKKTALDSGSAPSHNDEYLLYQTLIGCWPLEPLDRQVLGQFSERIETYMVKAVREAKQMSSWINPNLAYENALSTFIKALLAPGERNLNLFLTDFLPFQQLVSRLGMLNSLSQTLIKLTSPGMPDIYQGNELWNFSLVDPDNRRPVDYRVRRVLLEELQSIFCDTAVDTLNQVKKLLIGMEDARIKLYITWKCLQLRRQFEALFREGEYLPLQVEGPRREHICSFVRQYRGEAIAVVAPRLFYTLMDPEPPYPIAAEAWTDTYIELPETFAGTMWKNVLTTEVLELEREVRHIAASRLLAHFPYALLVQLH